MNLNVFIASCGRSSRRGATELIKEGKVAVNGKIVNEPWYKVRENDSVKVDGRVVGLEKKVYIIFNKPAGVTTTLGDRFAEEKITDYVPKRLGRVVPVGRLDKRSRGLMILTNDGDLCHRVTHPSFEVEKEYEVSVKGRVDRELVAKLKAGIVDSGDELRAREASIMSKKGERALLSVIVSEGKKRHIRRLFEGLGLIVMDLRRIRIGRMYLGDIKEGRYIQVGRERLYKDIFGPAVRNTISGKKSLK